MGMLSDLLSIFMSEVSAARLLREVRWSNGDIDAVLVKWSQRFVFVGVVVNKILRK